MQQITSARPDCNEDDFRHIYMVDRTLHLAYAGVRKASNLEILQSMYYRLSLTQNLPGGRTRWTHKVVASKRNRITF